MINFLNNFLRLILMIAAFGFSILPSQAQVFLKPSSQKSIPLRVQDLRADVEIIGSFAITKPPDFSPSRDAKWNSTREINDLFLDENNTLWAATSGGVLQLQNGAWTKQLSEEVLKIGAAGDGVGVVTPRGELVQTSRGWIDPNNKTQRIYYSHTPRSEVAWREFYVTINPNDLSISGTASAPIQRVPLPASSGTHISAVLPRGGVLWAAMFGDGIWEWNGKTWEKPALKMPDAAREITSLAQSKDGKIVWLGTRRAGVWEYSGNNWKQHLQPDEPFAHNIQFLQKFQGALYGSTLEDGLIIRNAKGWKDLDKSTLSSNAPRQLVTFQNKLYVRHSNEVVDCFDGKNWKQNAFPALPRKQIISIAADAKNLYLGQWGGWSAWDGKTFSHHLKIPELQIVPLMQIFPDTNNPKDRRLWLGTENRGLFVWNENSQTLQHFDEREGLPDDWVKSMNRSGSTLFAGTFKGGIAWRDEKAAPTKPRWQSDLKGSGITAIVVARDGSTLVGTHFGLYHRNEKGNFDSLSHGMQGDEQEIQALLATDEGLWIGTRTSLLFRTHASLKRLK